MVRDIENKRLELEDDQAYYVSTYLPPFGDVCSFLLVVNDVSEVLAERFMPVEYIDLFPSSGITADLLGMCRF